MAKYNIQGHSRRHPKAGQQVTVKNGIYKGRMFLVSDYLTSQYQGKSIHKIKAAHLTTPVVNRGFPLDDEYVFGQWYPTMEHACVHDSELKVKLEEAPKPTAEVAQPSNVESIKKKTRKKKDANESSPE